MNNKLFLICPDCFLEQLIEAEFGENIFFITALGSVFIYNDSELESILNFISDNNISDVFIVTDISCRFLNNVIEDINQRHFFLEEALENSSPYNQIDALQKNPSLEQKKYFAKINITNQAKEFAQHPDFIFTLNKNKVNLLGLITEKNEKKFYKFNLNNDKAYL